MHVRGLRLYLMEMSIFYGWTFRGCDIGPKLEISVKTTERLFMSCFCCEEMEEIFLGCKGVLGGGMVWPILCFPLPFICILIF